ncbi:hypothetical protein EW145_g8122, partial [Phellinidium pouzarii]
TRRGAAAPAQRLDGVEDTYAVADARDADLAETRLVEVEQDAAADVCAAERMRVRGALADLRNSLYGTFCGGSRDGPAVLPLVPLALVFEVLMAPPPAPTGVLGREEPAARKWAWTDFAAACWAAEKLAVGDAGEEDCEGGCEGPASDIAEGASAVIILKKETREDNERRQRDNDSGKIRYKGVDDELQRHRIQSK